MWRMLSQVFARFPGCCRVCGGWTAGVVCAPCRERFAAPRMRCVRCALAVGTDAAGRCPDCQRTPSVLDACWAALDYRYPWDGLIGDWKFRGDIGLGRLWGTWLREIPGLSPALATVDWIVPVPLSAQRLAERGHNQAWDLARALLRPGQPARACAQGLLRLRETPDQHRLGAQERRHNLRGVFTTTPAHASRLKGRHVLLVDDVMTTGATLHAAAEALRAAGVRSVSAVVLARTPLS